MSKIKKQSKIKKLSGLSFFKLFAFVLVFGAIAASFILYSQAAPKNRGGTSTVSMYLSPSSQKVSAGREFTVSVYEDSLANPINAVQANLSYDINFFDVLSIDTASSAFEVKAQVNSSNGVVNLGLGHIGQLTGKQLIANLVLKPKATGRTNIQFTTDSSLWSANANQNILQTTKGGSYNIR